MNVLTLSRYPTTAVVLAAVSLLACSEASPSSIQHSRSHHAAAPQTSAASDPVPSAFVAESAEQFPNESLSDWVSYADAVVVATIVEETALPAPREVAERQEGYVGRAVEARIEEVLWSANGPGKTLRRMDTLDMVVFGWIQKASRLVPIGSASSPRLEVGGEYVLPLVQFENGWGPMTPGAPVAVESSMIAQRDADEHHAASHAKHAFKGRSVSDIERLIANTTPDKLAALHWDLRPEARVRAVFQERNSPVPPHPPNVSAPRW